MVLRVVRVPVLNLNCCAPAEFRGVCSHVGSEGCVSVLGCWVWACVVVYEAYEHLNLVPRGVFT